MGGQQAPLLDSWLMVWVVGWEPAGIVAQAPQKARPEARGREKVREKQQRAGVTHRQSLLLSQADTRETTGQQAGLGTQGSRGISRSGTNMLWGSSCQASREGG